jgi:F-type H+-transporting ATPase subunit O
LFGVEGRYTTALYSAASKNSKLDAVEKDLRKVSAALENDSKFKDFLYNPLVQKTLKNDILSQTLTGKLGATDLTVNLIQSMVENGRIRFLPAVIKQYIRVMEVSRGEIEVTVTTAKPLSEEAVKKELEGALKGFTKNTLKIKMAVDPSIIGGIVVDFGGEHYIDMSIRSKIKLYTDLVQQPV